MLKSSQNFIFRKVKPLHFIYHNQVKVKLVKSNKSLIYPKYKCTSSFLNNKKLEANN